MVLYLATTTDKYELPIAVADSVRELAKMLKVHPNTISCHITLCNQGKLKKQKYFRVEVEDGEVEM